MISDHIIKNLSLLQQQLPPSLTLIAVSKGQAAEKILPVLGVGHKDFGENRIQEIKEKWPPLKARYPLITLHFIGPLQTNKVKDAVALCDVIHTLDRISLADALAKEMQCSGRYPRCLIQINTGNEPQKSGVSLGEADEFINYCINQLKLPIKGLMCIPPASDEPEKHFALLSAMASRLALPIVSMGMSNDYTAAIACGATHIRIGRAIFEKTT
jgi:pyridoxal phosphate enzyme (YggS family)